MINVKHLNSTRNGAIKNQVIIKTRNLPGTDTFQTWIGKFSEPAQSGCNGKGPKSFTGRFDYASRGIEIVPGNEFPNQPKFVLYARGEDELRRRHEPP